MPDALNRPNAVLMQAVQNPAGIPEVGDTNNPTVLLSTDDDGNLRTTASVSVVMGEVEIKNDSGNPVPISAASLPLPTGAATAALQTQPGVDIGDVTVNNAAGAAAVNVQDGGNVLSVDDAGGSLTVDGTVTQAQATTVPTQIIKTVAATNTPEALAADGTFFKTALLIANNAARTANTGKVWLGVTAGDGTQPIGMDAGTQRTIEAPEGQQYDLNDWYLDVETPADGVVIIYS